MSCMLSSPRKMHCVSKQKRELEVVKQGAVPGVHGDRLMLWERSTYPKRPVDVGASTCTLLLGNGTPRFFALFDFFIRCKANHAMLSVCIVRSQFMIDLAICGFFSVQGM